jgi:enolase
MEIAVILYEMQAELGVGANAMLAVSIAACKAGAAEKEVLFFC